MTCRKCQKAMWQGMTDNVCYITGEKVPVQKASCRICHCSKKEGIIGVNYLMQGIGGRLTSQTATENARIRFGTIRSKRSQVSISREVMDKFYQQVPEKDRRNRLDHAILVEIGEVQ